MVTCQRRLLWRRVTNAEFRPAEWHPECTAHLKQGFVHHVLS